MVLPLTILRAGKSQPALIELKSGETYSGILASCDSFMNVHMINAICTSKRGDEFWKLDECFIRGNNVKSFRLPEEVADLAVEDAKATARPSTSNSRARDRGTSRGRRNNSSRGRVKQ